MKPFVGFGEILFRFSAPQPERLDQTPVLDVHLAGSECNVVCALARWGSPASLISAVPEGALGERSIRELRSHGVDPSWILRQGERIGIFYHEHGIANRSGAVIYDRENSAFATADWQAFDWERALAGIQPDTRKSPKQMPVNSLTSYSNVSRISKKSSCRAGPSKAPAPRASGRCS